MVTLNLHSMRANNYRVVGYRVIATEVDKVIKIRPNCLQSTAQRFFLTAILTIGYVLGSVEPKLSAFTEVASNLSSVQSFCKDSFSLQEIRNHSQTIMFVKPPLWIQSSSDLAPYFFAQSHKVSEQTPSIESVSQSFDEEERRREEKIATLAKKGPSIANKMLWDLKDQDPDIRGVAAKVLGRIKYREAIPALTQMLKNDNDTEVKSAACEALGNMGDYEVLDHIIQALMDPDDRVRASAATSLTAFNQEKRAKEALQFAIKDENILVALAANKALTGEDELPGRPLPPLPKMSPSQPGFSSIFESDNKKVPNRAVNKTAALPQFEIIQEETLEGPFKTQVKMNLLVLGSITEDGLRALLLKIYDSSMTKGGYKYHPRPTVVAIYAYTSRAKYDAQAAQWVAMLLKHGDETSPKISVSDREITAASIKPEERFGLSEDERIKIYQELFQTLCKAEADGQRLAVDQATRSFTLGKNLILSKSVMLQPADSFDLAFPHDSGDYWTVPERSTIRILDKRESPDNIIFCATMLKSPGRQTMIGWVEGSSLLEATGVDPSDLFSKVSDLQDQLKTKYEEQIARKYNFTRFHTGQIDREGFRKNWPYPKTR